MDLSRKTSTCLHHHILYDALKFINWLSWVFLIWDLSADYSKPMVHSRSGQTRSPLKSNYLEERSWWLPELTELPHSSAASWKMQPVTGTSTALMSYCEQSFKVVLSAIGYSKHQSVSVTSSPCLFYRKHATNKHCAGLFNFKRPPV